MALDMKVIQHNKYLEIIISGIFDLNDAVDKFPKLLAACRSTGLQNILIDFRAIEGEPKATEKVLYTLGIQNHYQKYISSGGEPLKLAFVGKAPFVSDYEPGEMVAQNENLPFNLYTNIDEAFKWLNVKPS